MFLSGLKTKYYSLKVHKAFTLKLRLCVFSIFNLNVKRILDPNYHNNQTNNINIE